MIGRMVNNVHAVHLRGGVTRGRALRLRMMSMGPMTAFGPIVAGLYGLSSVRTMRGGTSNSNSFVMNAARCTVPLNGLVGARRRLTGLRTSLGCRRNFLRDMLGGLDGRGFIDGTPTGIVSVRHGGRTSTRDGVTSLGRDVTTLGGWGGVPLCESYGVLYGTIVASFLVGEYIGDGSTVILLRDSSDFSGCFGF